MKKQFENIQLEVLDKVSRMTDSVSELDNLYDEEKFILDTVFDTTTISDPIETFITLPNEVLKGNARVRFSLGAYVNSKTKIPDAGDNILVKLRIKNGLPSVLCRDSLLLPPNLVYDLHKTENDSVYIGYVSEIGDTVNKEALALDKPVGEVENIHVEPEKMPTSSRRSVETAGDYAFRRYKSDINNKFTKLRRKTQGLLDKEYKKEGFTGDVSHIFPQKESEVKVYALKGEPVASRELVKPIKPGESEIASSGEMSGHHEYHYLPHTELEKHAAKLPLRTERTKFTEVEHPKIKIIGKGNKVKAPDVIESRIKNILGAAKLKHEDIDTIYLNSNLEGERAALIKFKNGKFEVIDSVNKRQYNKEQQEKEDAPWNEQYNFNGKIAPLYEHTLDHATHALKHNMERHEKQINHLKVLHKKLKGAEGAEKKELEKEVKEQQIHEKKLRFIRDRNAAWLYQAHTGQRPGANIVTRKEKGVHLAGAFTVLPQHITLNPKAKTIRTRYVGKGGIDNVFPLPIKNPVLYKYFRKRFKEIEKTIKQHPVYFRKREIKRLVGDPYSPDQITENQLEKMTPEQLKIHGNFPIFENIDSGDVENFILGEDPKRPGMRQGVNEELKSLAGHHKSVDVKNIKKGKSVIPNPAAGPTTNLRDFIYQQTPEGQRLFSKVPDELRAHPYTFRRSLDKRNFAHESARLLHRYIESGDLNLSEQNIPSELKEKLITGILEKIAPITSHSPESVLENYIGEANARDVLDHMWHRFRKELGYVKE